MLPLSLSSFVSTLVVGPLFDKIGRKQLLLVTCTYFDKIDAMSGILLILSQYVDSLIGL
jgi:MFS family permease